MSLTTKSSTLGSVAIMKQKTRSRLTGGNGHNQAGAKDLFLELPTDLQLKVLDLLPHREKARLVVLSKAWREMILGSWISFDCECYEAGEAEPYIKWLKLLAKPRHSRQSLQNLQLLQLYGKPQAFLHAVQATIVRPTPLVRFENLRILTLWDCSPAPQGWTECVGLVATPRLIQDLTALQKLEELSVNYKPQKRAGTVTLWEFAGLPTLCKLAIKLNVIVYDAPEALTLDLAPKITDLTRLVDFAIHNLGGVNVNMALRSMVSRLESLFISRERGMHEVLHAPHLTSLGFWDLNANVHTAAVFPFQTSDRLRNLSLFWDKRHRDHSQNRKGSQLPILSQGQSLTRLRLSFAGSSLADLQHLRNLSNLSELHVDLLWLDKEARMQHLAMLKRLERLEISMMRPLTRDNFNLCHPVVLFAGQTLERLRVFKVRCRKKHQLFVLSHNSLPALEELQGIHVPWEGTDGGFALTLQQQQNLDYTRLPQLHTLDMAMVLLFSQPEDGLTQALQQLTSLRELSLGLSRRKPYNYPDVRRLERTKFIEVVLRTLASAKALKVLKLVSISDCLQLSRELIPPSVRHLSLACQQLDVHANCMPWKEESVDLHFGEPMRSTLQGLKMCKDLKVMEEHYSWDYFNACKAGIAEIGGRFKFDSAARIIEAAKSEVRSPFAFLQDSHID